MNADEIVRAWEALEVVFEHLDTKGWEDSYVYAGNAGSREPNTYFKETVADKKGYLYETLSSAISAVESMQAQLAEERRLHQVSVNAGADAIKQLKAHLAEKTDLLAAAINGQETLQKALAASQPENEPLICPLLSDAEVQQPCIEGPCPAYQTTNADRMRSMSGEELANQIQLIRAGALNEFLEALGVSITVKGHVADYQQTLHMLRQPAKEDT